MDKRPWQEYSDLVKEVFALETSPVAVNCIKEGVELQEPGKVRICRAILDVSEGKTKQICKENNACFGAAWHLGFQNDDDPAVHQMRKKFVVEGEKLFANYEALDKLIEQMEELPDNAKATFLLTPLEKAEREPELIIFVCNPEQACRLLTFATFFDGIMPKIKIGGPTCRMAIMYPLLTGQVNISFQDYTARKMSKMAKDKLLVTVPYSFFLKIIDHLDTCSGGRAKMEFPPEFRAFLQKRAGIKKE